MARITSYLSAVATLVLAAAANAHVVETTYASRADAEAKGALSEKLVPNWLPSSATNIREAHNGHNVKELLLRLTMPSGEAFVLPATCRRVNSGEVPKPSFKRAWWPGDLASAQVGGSKYLLHLCGEYFVGQDSGAPAELYIWRSK